MTNSRKRYRGKRSGLHKFWLKLSEPICESDDPDFTALPIWLVLAIIFFGFAVISFCIGVHVGSIGAGVEQAGQAIMEGAVMLP